MNMSSLNAESLNAIQPNELVAYLQANGWYQARPFYESASVWLKQIETGEEFELLLPLRPDWLDYTVRVRELLQTLERVEKRPQIEIFGDLVTQVSALAIQGIITHIDPTLDRTAAGAKLAILTGIVFGKFQPIHLELTPSIYPLAQQAYFNRRLVTCQGNLIKQDGVLVLQDLACFELASSHEASLKTEAFSKSKPTLDAQDVEPKATLNPLF